MDKSAFDTSSGAPSSETARSDSDAVAPQLWYELILRRCGLAFRHARLADVMGVVREQAKARGVSSEAYYHMLSKPGEHAADWEALVERLINHETSFFRHPPSFDALQRHILPELRDARPRGGRRGRYGPRAVATVRADYRQRFLRPVNEPATEYEVVDELRQRTRFMAANLVGNDTFTVSYDVIFCHNVLIYFSPAAVTQAVAFLASRLTLGGYLLLGPGEAPSERPIGLVQVSINGVRAFQRRSARSTEVRS
jgi:chemotaxis methyl-accepting protein methylase